MAVMKRALKNQNVCARACVHDRYTNAVFSKLYSRLQKVLQVHRTSAHLKSLAPLKERRDKVGTRTDMQVQTHGTE